MIHVSRTASTSPASIDSDAYLVLWVSARPSPLLSTHDFLNLELGASAYAVVGNLLFYFDSAGTMPDMLTETGARPPPSELERLLAGRGDASVRLVEVNLLGADTGTAAIRSKTLRAADLQDSAPDINDHARIPSTARAHLARNEPPKRLLRYVGLTRGRINDRRQRGHLGEFGDWAATVAHELELADESSNPSVLRRYARESDPATDPEPVHILVDTQHVVDAEEFHGLGLESEGLDSEVTTGRFSLHADPANIDIAIAYDPKTSRYRLSTRDTRSAAQKLVNYLNVEQAIRVIPRGSHIHTQIYAHGNWYRPVVDIAGSQAPDFLALFEHAEPLVGITSEKGTTQLTKGPINPQWPEDSLFGHLDRNPVAFAGQHVDIVVCDDMGRESADFWLSAPEQICMVHLKHTSSSKPQSASAFADVCSQAIKNLYLLDVFTEDKPGNLDRWDLEWNDKGHKVAPRVRKSPASTAVETWKFIAERRRAPRVRREVLIVMSNGYDANGLESRIQQKAPTYQDIQVFFQLTTLYAAASSMGAALRVMTGPVGSAP